MDPQLRNIKDFLQLYNKITEHCFSKCVDNFFNRNISDEESSCISNCVDKFAKVNQRIMGVYVEVQTTVNNRRMAELEAHAQQQQEAAIQTELVKNASQIESETSSVEIDSSR